MLICEPEPGHDFDDRRSPNVKQETKEFAFRVGIRGNTLQYLLVLCLCIYLTETKISSVTQITL